MPLSKAKQAEYQKMRRQAQKRLAGAHLLSKNDVRAIRKAGLRVEDLEGEEGTQVAFQTFSALLRDRDAIRAHLEWHHESMRNPDVATILERASAQRADVDEQRIMQLESEMARLEAMLDSVLHEAREE